MYRSANDEADDSARIVLPFLSESNSEISVLKSELLAATQREIQSHDFTHFVDEPPSVAEGGKGVVVPGRPKCRVRIHTMSQFLDHLSNDAMPALIERLAQISLGR